MTSLAARYRIRGPLWIFSRAPLVFASLNTADTSPDSLSNHIPAPTTIKANPPPYLATPRPMPLSPYPHRTHRSTDAPMKDPTPIVNFVDTPPYDLISPPDSDQMIFGPLDLDDPALLPHSWDPSRELSYNQPISPILSDNPASPRRASDFDIPDASPSSTFYDSHSFGGFDDVHSTFDLDDSNLSQWLNDSHASPLDPSSSSPIPIRGTQSDPQSPPAFITYGNHAFHHNTSFSPSDFAALHPLPRSLSPAEVSDGYLSSPGLGVASISPAETSLRPPAWASQLWDSSHYTPSTTSGPLSENPYTAKGQRFHPRKDTNPLGLMFQSSSAPSPNVATLTRAYSRRAESVSVNDDRDATVRRRKKSPLDELPRDSKPTESCTCISDHIRPFCDCRHADCLLHYLRYSSCQISVEAAQISTVRLAALLHRLDPAPPGNKYEKTQCCTGCQGSRSGVCEPDRGRKGGMLLRHRTLGITADLSFHD